MIGAINKAAATVNKTSNADDPVSYLQVGSRDLFDCFAGKKGTVMKGEWIANGSVAFTDRQNPQRPPLLAAVDRCAHDPGCRED